MSILDVGDEYLRVQSSYRDIVTRRVQRPIQVSFERCIYTHERPWGGGMPPDEASVAPGFFQWVVNVNTRFTVQVAHQLFDRPTDRDAAFRWINTKFQLRARENGINELVKFAFISSFNT